MLVYDASCGLCRASVTWIGRRAARGAFEFLPCQAAERRARFPAMAEEQCLAAMQLVLDDGRVLPGDAAIREILVRLRRWRWLAVALHLPGAGRLAPVVYGWVARHRHRLSGGPGARRG